MFKISESHALTQNEQRGESKPLELLEETTLCGATLSVYGTAAEPLFKAKEVADIIEHTNISRMLELVDDEEKGVNQLLTPGGYQQVWFLTEQGLYEVLMQSRKPIAKQFKRGVKDLLKGLRTRQLSLQPTGEYPSGMYLRRTARLMDKVNNQLLELKRRYTELEMVSRLVSETSMPQSIGGIEPLLYKGNAWYPLKALLLSTTEATNPKVEQYTKSYPGHTLTLYQVAHCDTQLAQYIYAREELRRARKSLVETSQFDEF